MQFLPESSSNFRFYVSPWDLDAKSWDHDELTIQTVRIRRSALSLIPFVEHLSHSSPILGIFPALNFTLFLHFLQQRKQDRVKRTIANREALFKLASDLETFMIWNDKQCCRTTSFEYHQTTRHQNQTAQLASEIADGFDRLSQRYARDLKQAEEFSCSLWSPGQLQK